MKHPIGPFELGHLGSGPNEVAAICFTVASSFARTKCFVAENGSVNRDLVVVNNAPYPCFFSTSRRDLLTPLLDALSKALIDS